MKNRVYSNILPFTLAAMGNRNIIWYLNNYRKSFKLKSIFFDLRITQDVGTQNQIYVLFIGSLEVPIQQTENYENYNVSTGGDYNGVGFAMTKPGQILFDSFFIRERLKFQFLCANSDLLVAYDYLLSVTCEIEDI